MSPEPFPSSGEGGGVRGTQHPSRVPGSTTRAAGAEAQAADKRARAEQRKQKQHQRSEAEQVMKADKVCQKDISKVQKHRYRNTPSETLLSSKGCKESCNYDLKDEKIKKKDIITLVE